MQTAESRDSRLRLCGLNNDLLAIRISRAVTDASCPATSDKADADVSSFETTRDIPRTVFAKTGGAAATSLARQRPRGEFTLSFKPVSDTMMKTRLDHFKKSPFSRGSNSPAPAVRCRAQPDYKPTASPYVQTLACIYRESATRTSRGLPC